MHKGYCEYFEQTCPGTWVWIQFFGILPFLHFVFPYLLSTFTPSKAWQVSLEAVAPYGAQFLCENTLKKANPKFI